MSQWIIKSRKVVSGTEVKEAFVVIKNGMIADVVPELKNTDGLPVTDIGDKVLMPGVFDPHVHINEPGRTEWEGFLTATKAAARGGVTSLVDMPLNSSPVTTSLSAFHQKLEATKDKLTVNLGFWGGIVPGNEAEVEPLIEAGVLGFKAFLTHSGIDEFPNVTERDLRKVMPLIARYHLPLLVHCEVTGAAPGVTDHRSYRQYLASRPVEWENEAIDLMIRLCEEFQCPVHIVHLSSANAIEPVRKAKEKGLPLTVETAQHYLYFTADEIPDGRTEFKCAPPIRDSHNNERLWEALMEGVIDFVATDHSPAPPELKEKESGNLTKAWGGIASLQFAWSSLWTAGRKRGASLTQMARWLSEAPALLAGQGSKRGVIKKGMAADLIIVDPDQTYTVREKDIFHKNNLTPYLNHELNGVIEQTILKGTIIFNKGQVMEEKKGELILRNTQE